MLTTDMQYHVPRWQRLCLCACFFFLIACAKDPAPQEPRLPQVSMESPEQFVQNLQPKNQYIPSWRAMETSLRRSLRYVKTKNATDIAIDRPGLRLSWGQMAHTLTTLIALLPQLDANPKLFLERFTWVPVQQGIMYSGYYEPVLKASRTPKPGYHPLYKVPPDLAKYRKRKRAYHSREAIDKDKVLAGRGLELAYAESLVDIFYLQIQGSGKLAFDDGSSVYVNYAGQNGHKYVSSGRIMRERGLLKTGDVEEQRQWFKDNPHRVWEILRENPSYVFFRFGTQGSVGAMGHPLEAWKSVATDRRFIPLGSVIAYGVNIPDAQKGTIPLRALGTAQDVGGAIKQNRIDIFCGGGEQATYVASHLDAKGPAWVLVSKDVYR